MAMDVPGQQTNSVMSKRVSSTHVTNTSLGSSSNASALILMEPPRDPAVPSLYTHAPQQVTPATLENVTSPWNWTELHGSEDMFPGSHDVWIVLLILLILATILGNLLVIVTIMKNRRLHKARNYFIFNLAVTDLLLGVFVLPPSAFNTLASTWTMGATACNLFVGTDVMLCTASIVQLFIISMERYLAIRHPFVYERIVNKRRVSCLIAALWVFSAVLAYLPLFMGWNTASGQVQNVEKPEICFFENTNATYILSISIGTFFGPLACMIFAYCMIFSTVRAQTRRINQQYNAVPNGSRELGVEPKRATETRAARMLFVVIATFIVCWFPYFVLFTLKPYIAHVNMYMDITFLWLGYGNSMMNPFLYAFYSTEFKYGFLLVLNSKKAARFRKTHPEIQNL